MRAVTVRPALIVLALSACGPAAGLEASAQRLGSPAHLSVEWSVDSAGDAVTDTDHGRISIGDYPVGWYAWWDCASYRGELKQVYVNEQVKNGRFVPAAAMPVATGPCFGTLSCPDNCVMGPDWTPTP